MDTVIVAGALVPSGSDTPLDGRSKIATLANYTGIVNPYVGLNFRTDDTGIWYEVTSVKEVTEGLTKKKVIDTYKKRDLSVEILPSVEEYNALPNKDDNTMYVW